MPGTGWKRTGKVVFIDNAVEPGTSTIRARIEVPNADRAIAPGAYVSVRFPSELLKGAVSIPESAIVYETAAATAWVLEADGTARQRVLRTGPRGGAGIVVTDGIKPDDRVVVEGMQKLRDGAKTIDADQMRQMMQGKGEAKAPAEGAAR
jgi:RND family efflux transporter MFP subunit